MPASMQIDRAQVRVGDVIWSTNVGPATLLALPGTPMTYGAQTYAGAYVRPVGTERDTYVSLPESLLIDQR